MSDEIRNEEIEVTTEVETEDVKEGLGPMEYGVIAGLMAAGVLVFEGGKWVWKKTEAPRKKTWGFVTGIFSKNKDSKKIEVVPEHEGATEVAAEVAEEKKSDSKKDSKKK